MKTLERHRRGSAAEDAVAAYVRHLGMNVVGRNVRVGHLEIDLVARDSNAMVVVEVRTRGSTAWLGALHSLDFDKRERLRRAATILWLRRWTHLRGVTRVRFDAAAVDLDSEGPPRVLYVRAAF